MRAIVNLDITRNGEVVLTQNQEVQVVEVLGDVTFPEVSGSLVTVVDNNSLEVYVKTSDITAYDRDGNVVAL
tara:strand:+ start:248 stop:463 length:216 start_codon:yes stop_codon:yes gene_type:complete